MAKQLSRHRQAQTVSGIRRGDICLVAFDPTVGYEIQKTRPALIIQNNVGNTYSPLTIVAAITSNLSPVPFPVEVVVLPTKATGLTATSAIRLDQIRTIDRQRILRRLGAVDAAVTEKVDEAIKISLGLIDIEA